MIITFYSFKGGVGRSMALANVAELFYRKGLRVVVVDWDLEAPGLESYLFDKDEDVEKVRSQLGVIDIILDYKRKFPRLPITQDDKDNEKIVAILDEHLPPITDVLYPIYAPNETEKRSPALWLLPAGWRSGKQFAAYAQSVQSFDWAEFYDAYHGEAFFEWMRRQFFPKRPKFLADVVLIDSRTGVTEMGGVCTRQLADAIALFVAPNQQNLDGIAMMARSFSNPQFIQEGRQGRELSLVFVPARVEHSESELLDTFAQGFNRVLGEFATSKLTFEKNMFLDLKIPYVPYYAYMEKLAVRDSGRASASELTPVYENLCSKLAQIAPNDTSLFRSYYRIGREELLIGLRDISVNARQESIQMRHHYLGVEHLFISMLQIKGGLLGSIIEKLGLTTDYVIEAIRRKVGKGSRQRLWAGIPYTPRAEVVLNIANEIALENGFREVGERELLQAILEEGRSLPIRVLSSLHVDLNLMKEDAKTLRLEITPLTNLTITFSENFPQQDVLSREHLFVLRRMFSDGALRIERRLTSLGTRLVLVVTPIHADGREDAPVIVKIDLADNILDEVQRYGVHVKSSVPPQAARLEDNPTVPEASELAGIKYTLVVSDGTVPQDLHSYVQLKGAAGLGELIKKELYEQFNKAWWQQRRAFRFQVWQEYDWLLPPILTLDYTSDQDTSSNPYLIKVPIQRSRLKAKLHDGIQFGDEIVLENFAVNKVDRAHNTLKLAIGYGSEADKQAYRIDVRGLNLSQTPFYRGEVVERLVGKVWKTRHEVLLDSARALEPDFDLDARWIPIEGNQIFNPLIFYEDLLDRHVNGSVSRIHGNLHMGNILIGSKNKVWLIDFGQTRDGHTLFDWANLEVSLLSDAAIPLMGSSWAAVKEVIQYLIGLNSKNQSFRQNSPLVGVMEAVVSIRAIVQECLIQKDAWDEYYIPLALCALRNVTFETLSLYSRRLMFLLAGAMMSELYRNYFDKLTSTTLAALETPSPDETDFAD